VAQGIPGRLRLRIFWKFGTTRMVDGRPYPPTAFTQEKIHGTQFQRLIQPQCTWIRSEQREKSPVTPPGIDPGTSLLVAHYANSGPGLRNWTF